MKPIYNAPIVDQIKDLKRACEMALELLDVMPLRNITAEDMKREGLNEGEFALWEWVVRPRFKENQDGCFGAPTYVTTFDDWWNSLPPVMGNQDARTIGNPLKGETFSIGLPLAKVIWRSMGLSSS